MSKADAEYPERDSIFVFLKYTQEKPLYVYLCMRVCEPELAVNIGYRLWVTSKVKKKKR